VSLLDTPLTRRLGIEVPLICGAMYPCSNPELVAAVSEAGGIGIVQPLSLTFVHGYDFREGLQVIRRLTAKPIGMNVLIEQSSKAYLERMRRYLDLALEDGIRFFVTSLGNPRWVVERATPAGGVVFHDVTERKWAEKALAGGVHGLIAVNDRAGGHAGPQRAEQLLTELADLGVPLVCAGGIGDAAAFVAALRLGYAGAQLGTRFIATDECHAAPAYKRAIVDAEERDIVLTERVTGVPLAVIRTPYVERVGTHAGPIARRLLRGRRTKHFMRTVYALRSAWKLKHSLMDGRSTRDYWQAGKSVAGIHAVEPAGAVVRRFAEAARRGADDPVSSPAAMPVPHPPREDAMTNPVSVERFVQTLEKLKQEMDAGTLRHSEYDQRLARAIQELRERGIDADRAAIGTTIDGLLQRGVITPGVKEHLQKRLGLV
jgi:nitronate monooxygenase